MPSVTPEMFPLAMPVEVLILAGMVIDGAVVELAASVDGTVLVIPRIPAPHPLADPATKDPGLLEAL